MTGKLNETGAAQTYREAICLPCGRPTPRRPGTGGIFDVDGQVIPASLLRRFMFPAGTKPFDAPDLEGRAGIATQYIVGPGKLGKTRQHLVGRHIFGGYLLGHFGHFLLESLARLWFIRRHPDVPLIWIPFDGDSPSDWQREILDVLGVKNPMVCIAEQTAVEELVLPEPGYVIPTRFWQVQAEALGIVPPCPATPGKKIWLSRSGLRTGAVINEPILETMLEKDGWIVFRPEQHPVRSQLDMLKDAETIAGIEGSAFHLLVLIPHFAGQVVLVPRVDAHDFDLIAETLGLRQTSIAARRHDLPTVRNAWGSEANGWWRDLDIVLDRLGGHRPTPAPDPLPMPFVNIARSVATHYKLDSFVELGPCQNILVDDVPVRLRVAVTADARFDVAAARRAGVSYFDLAPDIFMASAFLKGPPGAYCLREAGHFESALRLFNLTAGVSAPDTLWLVEAADPQGANAALLAHLARTNPAISGAWVAGHGMAVLWRAMRPFALPALGALRRTDLGQAAEADLPRWSLQQIAEQIDRDRANHRINAL